MRTLPGICGGFAAAYGTDELVTAFDRMSIQRPATCGSERVQNIKRGEDAFDQRHLHTHFNQDGFGDDVLVCYGIMSLWDMNRKTGGESAALLPFSPLTVVATALFAHSVSLPCLRQPRRLYQAPTSRRRWSTSEITARRTTLTGTQ